MRDGRYSVRAGTGDVLGLKSAALKSRQTTADFSKPSPPEKELDHPIVRMPNMTSAVEPTWADNHDESARFIRLISGVYRVPRCVILGENVAISSAMSPEAPGAVASGAFAGIYCLVRDSAKPRHCEQLQRS